MNIQDNIKLAKQITTVTLVGYIGEYPMERGNCFSVSTDDGEFRILNFNYENLKKLLKDNVVEWPIKISALSPSHAIICDHRIPDEWYSKKFCETCTPIDLLPVPQRLRHFLDIERGKREEKMIEINGKPVMMVSVKIGK